MKIISFIHAPDVVQKILIHLGEPTTPPPLAPARGPPQSRFSFGLGLDGRDGAPGSTDFDEIIQADPKASAAWDDDDGMDPDPGDDIDQSYW